MRMNKGIRLIVICIVLALFLLLSSDWMGKDLLPACWSVGLPPFSKGLSRESLGLRAYDLPLRDYIIAYWYRFVKVFGKIFFKNFVQILFTKILQIVYISKITPGPAVLGRSKNRGLARPLFNHICLLLFSIYIIPQEKQFVNRFLENIYNFCKTFRGCRFFNAVPHSADHRPRYIGKPLPQFVSTQSHF